MTQDPLTTATDAARAAYAATSGDHHTRLDAAFATLLGQLADAGLYRPPTAGAEPTDGELDQAAQWLAEQSRHPRYWPVDRGGRGHTLLLTREADIEVATKSASKNVGPHERQALSQVRSLLLRHAGRRVRSWDGG